MECFKHENTSAVGICKSCNKAVCRDCAIEIPNGLACSDECAHYISELNEMNERGLKIYGIGKHKSKMPATGVIVWFLLALVMWLAFLGPYLRSDEINSGSLMIAIIFTFIWGLTLYSAKRTGLKC